MAPVARETWTDERLDDLKDEMHRGFAQVRREMDRRFDEVDRRFDKVDRRFDKVDERFDRVDERFDRVDRRFEALEARFDAMQRTIVAGCFAIAAAVIAAGIF